MPRRKDIPDLDHIEIESGVSLFTGKGFCTVTATGSDHTYLRGQLEPEQVRTMALHWLAAAEAAEHDSAVWAELGAMNVSDEHRAEFIANLRQHREEETPEEQ